MGSAHMGRKHGADKHRNRVLRFLNNIVALASDVELWTVDSTPKPEKSRSFGIIPLQWWQHPSSEEHLDTTTFPAVVALCVFLTRVQVKPSQKWTTLKP